MSDAEIAALEERLPFCPRCGYTLRGLPAAHRCPECSLEYDESSCIWVAKRIPRGHTLLFLSSATINLFFGIRLTSENLLVTGRLNWLGIVAMVNVILGLVALWLWYRRRRNPLPYLAVVRDGVWYHRWPWRPRGVPWSRLLRAESARSAFGRVLSITRKNRTPLIIADVFDSPDEVLEAVDAISARLGEQSRLKAPTDPSSPS